jgi:phosphotriesterase-related protein
MTTINTVTGPMDSADLGFTLMHEHIMVAAAGAHKDYPELLGPAFMANAVEKLQKTREAGVSTILDATTLDLGRDIELIAEASRRSGINIIACTGWWLDYPRFFAGVSSDQLARVFVREIEQGIGGTGIKAGILKSASDLAGVTPEGDTVLRAIARAHKETGVPIMLHSYSPGRVGFQQLAIMKDEGVAMNRIKLDHSNDTTDVEYLTMLLEEGCYLGLDRYPGFNTSPMARTKTMKALIDAGYADRLCPSHDHSAISVDADNPLITKEQRLKMNPHGFLYIKNVVFPWLREMGVSEDIIDGLCVNGPRKFFEET